MTTARAIAYDPKLQFIWDPLDQRRKIVEVDLPEGYRRVYRGMVKPGDLYLNAVLLADGIVKWEEAPEPDAELLKMLRHTGPAVQFMCLIRKDGGGEVERPCERCRIYGREPKLRYCSGCLPLAIEEQKQAGTQRLY